MAGTKKYQQEMQQEIKQLYTTNKISIKHIINKYLRRQFSIMADLTDSLIQYQARKEDQEFELLYQGLFELFDDRQEKQCSEHEHSEIDEENSAETWDQPIPESHRPLSSKASQKTNHSNFDQSSEDYSGAIKRTKYKKSCGDKPKGYPTKNFLPCFKMPHLDFLCKKLGKDYVNSFAVVKRLRAKNGISMKDYEDLYSIEEFREAFEQFFEDQVLYRELMVSRATLEVKKIHQKKLYVFYRAFRQNQFNRIN